MLLGRPCSSPLPVFGERAGGRRPLAGDGRPGEGRSTYSHGAPFAAALAVAVAIGFGAAIQAMVGAGLVRAARGPGNPLDPPGSVAPLLLLGGPVSCLVNPTWGVCCLWLGGWVAGADVGANWFTWLFEYQELVRDLEAFWCRPVLYSP